MSDTRLAEGQQVRIQNKCHFMGGKVGRVVRSVPGGYVVSFPRIETNYIYGYDELKPFKPEAPAQSEAEHQAKRRQANRAKKV